MTAVQVGILAVTAIAGAIIGWLLRSRRASSEQTIQALTWQDRLAQAESEIERLTRRSESLMEQASQHQASQQDATNRARELASALKEAFERRDQLQRQIKDIRGNLETSLAEQRRLAGDVEELSASDSQLSGTIREKDHKIFRLSRDLESWKNRLPPLIERFQDRDRDARRLEIELDRANERIFELESGRSPTHTYVETLRRDAASNELDASNDPLPEHSGVFRAAREESNGRELSATLGGIATSGMYEPPDDLQAIKGVGPAIEKTLHELGIFRYSQIAEMSEYEINRVADRLKGFRSRIYREDWIGQARELLDRYRRTH